MIEVEFRKIEQLQHELDKSDAVVIGAGAGLSTSAGFTYTGERFHKFFQDFINKYWFKDMYSGAFIHLELWKSIGHTGQGIFTSTVTWM